MIKAIQIIADSTLSGGPIHVLGLLQNIDRSEFDNYLICPRGYLAKEAKRIPRVNVSVVEMRSKFDLQATYKISKQIRAIQSGKDPFTKVIVHIHGTRAGFLARLSIPRGVKVIYTEHRLDADYRLKNIINYYLQKKILGFLNSRTDAIIAVSSSVKDFLSQKRLAESNKIVVIPNAINAGKSVERELSGNNDPVIGSVGNLNIQKGQKYLIAAMPKILRVFSSAKLEIIGEGEEKNELSNLILSLGLKKSVKLLGRKEDIKEYMAKWDVFVLPSVAETFGLVILEAMQAGTPVVASNVGGIRDIIKDNKNGLLVDSRNPDKLAASIIKILSDPSQANKLSEEASKGLARFDWSNVVKEIERVYEKI